MIRSAPLTAVARVFRNVRMGIISRRTQFARLIGILKLEIEQLVQCSADLFIADGKHQFDPAVEIAGHPIGTAEEILRFTAVVEAEYPAVFKIAVNDTDDPHVFLFCQRTVAAYTAHDQLKFDS